MGGYMSLHNTSTAFTDMELVNALPDLQSQVSYLGEFWWYWGLHASLDINGSGAPVVITDYPGPNDPQDCLGYHSVDGNYQPYAVIFAGLSNDRGESTTGVISHEVLEILADQQLNTVNLIEKTDGTGLIVYQEVCDPCESLYYEGPYGSIVSDFVLPGWWVPGYQFQVDFLGLIPGPLRVASGDYTPCREVTLSSQIAGDDAQLAINDAAVAVRDVVAAEFSARVDMLDRLQSRQGVARPQSTAAATAARKGPSGPTIAERRRQPAMQDAKITVVTREGIPKFGHRVGAQPGQETAAGN
jgi:hypothetical protein